MTPTLHRAAKCWCLFVEGNPASFAGVIHRAGKTFTDVKAFSRIVTLPDYQGIGLAFVLCDAIGGIYKALDFRLRTYPAHPPFIRSHYRSLNWRLFARRKMISISKEKGSVRGGGDLGREGATFEYCGIAHPDIVQAERMYREPVR
jgi:hypothetical protein